MKKIIVMLAAVLVAVFAEAAQVKWSCANVFNPDGAKSTSIGYMFAASDMSAVSAALALEDSAVAASTLMGLAVSSAKPTTAGAYAGPAVDYAAGSASFFAVIFDGDTIADSSSYYMTATKTVTVPSSGAAGVAFGNLSAATSAAGAYTAAGWATPEPTSGMLLLLGGALLALRRKQK